MKIEKLSDNKIRITLTFDELEKRDISLNDIEKDASKAKDLFIGLLEESNLENEFEFDDSQLYIEACSDNNNLFIVTITKIDNMPEFKKYSRIDKSKNSSSNLKSKYNKYGVDGYIYSFSDIENILNLCSKAQSEDLFFGRNSLYKFEDTYFIIFSKATIKNKKFLKTYVFLSEYCKEYFSYDLFETLIIEKSKLIIKNNALQKLSLV